MAQVQHDAGEVALVEVGKEVECWEGSLLRQPVPHSQRVAIPLVTVLHYEVDSVAGWQVVE
jgi:hypothetical protein